MAERFELVTKRQLDMLPLNGSILIKDGGQVATGYKPDRVYEHNGEFWVVEIESSTSRKGFIGGYLKAQKYFHEEHEGLGKLLFVINERKRNLHSVSEQVKQYHLWLAEQGVSVQPTYFLYDTQLREFVAKKVKLFSKSFLAEPTVCVR